MKKTDKKTVNTKESILETALSLFAQFGYEAVSTQQIAMSLNITKGALYKHYESKQAIFDSILDRMEKTDALSALDFNMPMADEGPCNATIEDLIAYSRAMFSYWTRDVFASRFRRMLTIEQYKSERMQSLMRQYLTSGLMEYVESILQRMGLASAKTLAVEFYAPMFLLYDLEDIGNADALLDSHFKEIETKVKDELHNKT